MSSFSSSGNQESDSRSAPSHKWIHDVFVSFTKEDAGHDFVSDLCARLRRAGVRVFKDEMEPRSGDQILLQAIEGSKISIVVFSRNYANSTWCFQELVKIMECRRSKGQVVVPVFYGVDPSEVRDQTGRFGEALGRIEERQSTNKNKVFSYRNALKEAAAISGFVVSMGFSEESEDIDHIVEHVTALLDSTVGVHSLVQDIIQRLDHHKSDEVILLGIWGMGGSGKTTIAKALYNQISRNFDGTKFLANIREKWENKSKVSLQEELLSCIYKTRTTKIHDIELGKLILKKSLCCKRVFLVLDDVTELDQLKALCGSHEWFGPGSRIIITTRDKYLLNVHGVDHIYMVKIMNYDESIELFVRYAFDNAIPEGLISRVVRACAGLPVALEEMGSHLRGKSSEEWMRALQSLVDYPAKEIQSILKLSFFGLSETSKKIFLDIASFGVGMDRNDVIQILSGSIYNAEIGINELVDKSLVTFAEENKLRMHDLLQFMGKEIVRQASQIKPEPRTYDVFLSFRGEDTHTIFTSHLHTSLESAGFNVFKDDDALPRGEQIELSVLEAIGDSRICVIVLSTNYADSRWCLQELENIMECYRPKTHMVVPIFYCVDPSEVRNQTGKFGQAFEKLMKRIAVKEDKVLSWRTTLREVGSLSGRAVANSRNQSEAIDDIVEHITSLLHSKDLIVPEYLVGVQSHVQVVAQLLKNEKPDHVLLLGIWGMAGIGKTTIAKALYNEISQNFEGRKFIPDVRDEWTGDRKTSLQEQLLSSVDETNSTMIHSIELGKLILRDRLSLKRIFLVLDDVTNLDQLDALCGNREWFGPGSRIIITTRDKNLLNVLKVDHVYRVNEMNYNESEELFSWHAFKKATPEYYFAGLVKHVVEYCGGLPLALTVLGCFLRENGRSIEEWESALERFKSEPQQELQKKLKTSFDDISDDKMKNIFLDIACFLVGMDQKDVTQLLYGSGYKAETGIRVLEEKCLVTVGEKNNLQMHGLLQQMGREIARKASQIMPKLEYDVFLSFRGKDTHATFSSLLHTSLEKAGISVFKDVDDDAHRREERMSIQQLKAIRMSKFCVIVFSRNYADSKWCLLELENIIDCHKTKQQVVVPVFYDVDPEDVRNETGMIWEAFQDLINRTSAEENKVRSWRDALREAGGILGFVVEDYSKNRGEDVKKVAECLTRWVNRTNLFVATHPVGVQDGVHFLVKQLNEQKSDDVLLLGIWGMGGIGKTTLAKALYNQIGCEFDGSSFLLDIRQAWQREWHASLQERILSDIFLRRQRTIPDIESGKRRLEQGLRDTKVLLLLDGVNKMEQLDALCGSRKWFGPGSIIIITTRDKRLLTDHRVDLVHTMKEMDESESTELFSWHAFRQPSPRQDFAELCGNVVSYCGGLPLALFVLGTELFGKDMTEWKSVLDGLKESPHPDVQDLLRISFDDLNDDKERNLFLDISFFYIGISKQDVMVRALEGYGDSVESGITVLEARSLVKVDENGEFGMHILLREMGREILHELFRIEPGPKIYDVFLSFRADTRASFTSHLYTYLQNAGCHVFKDDESLQKGDQISISMMQAIGRSRISIVVLSEKYPNSRWCMMELEKILECRGTTNQKVLPVFYGVKPSEVRNSGVPSEELSKFREAFEELLKNVSVDKDGVAGWRAALVGIGAIQGHVIANSWNESKDIKKVVKDITRMLNRKYLHVAEHPVGVESRVDDVIQLLDDHKEKDVLVLGIWGMGGAGKTTTAKATYNRIGDKFEGRSFLLDVRKVWKETNGPVSLQKQLLSDVYEGMEIKIDNIDEGKKVLQEKLRQKKILLVLDDVNDQEQLNALCGSYDWFREESRIIITTRDKKLVAGVRKGEEKLQARVREVGFEIYPLEKMEERESIELFSWHAFQQAIPIEGFHELSGNIVSYSGGLPLALEVLGSYLLGRGLEDWTSVLNRLKRIPDDRVQEKLKISYDGLSNHKEKDIFLDIACFFIGMDRNDVILILDGCGFSATTHGIKVLEERSLVTVARDNKLGMHNLLRDMGREIVRQQSPKELEKRSRLWDSNDVLDVLQSKVRKGTGNIEGLALKLSKIKKIKLSSFEMMDKLRLLKLDGVELDGNFENMSRDLRWLYWRRFPSSHTPAEFDQGKLVAIELEHSNLKLMSEETQMLDKLKVLNLSHSHHLTKTPDFSYLPNLEKLSLEDCSELFYVSSTIGRLKKLKIINLTDCKNIRELPHRIYKLTSLQTLILSGCEKINKLEEHLEQMKSLTTLEADGTGIGQMPCALIRSKSIDKISWRDWKGISRVVFPSMIIWSWTSPTNNVSSRMRSSAGLWSCLVSVIVPNSSFQGLSSIVSELPRLRSLWLECSSQFQISGDEALDTLNADLEPTTTTSLASNVNTSAFADCGSQGDIFRSKYSLNFRLIQMGMESPITKILRESIFQKLRTSWPGDCLLPDDSNRDCLTFNGERHLVTFEVPDQVNGRNLKSVILCIAYSSSTDSVTSEGVILKKVSIMTQKTTFEYEGDRLASLEDEDWQRVVSNLRAGNKVDVVVHFGYGFIVRKTAIHLIYDGAIDKSIEHYHADVIGKQERLTSFQVSQPTPAFVEADATLTNQIEKWLDEEDTHSRRKTKIPSSSQIVVAVSQKVEATQITKSLESSPIAIPTASLSDSPDMLGNEITAQNQEDLQLQETPLAPNTKYTELTLTAKGVEKTHETSIVCPTSMDMPSDPISTITTIIPSMGAEDDELDEDGEILAELDKILSESYISSPKKVDSAASESEVKSLPVITIFNSIQGLLDNQLEILVADGDIKKQLLECLAQLGRMKSQVPTNLQPLVTDIKKFYEEVVNNFPSVQEVLGNHQRLIDTKNRLEEELETAKARQAHFSASISKGQERLNEMSKEITDLEEKLKALSEKREKLQSTLKLSETANQNINKKVATLLKESKEVVSDLKVSKSSFKEAKSSKQNYDRKLVDLKQALGNIRP